MKRITLPLPKNSYSFILYPLFLFFIGIFAGCVSQKKNMPQKQINEAASQAKATSTPKEPIITAISSQYLLKDSSIVTVFMEVEIENFDSSKGLQGFKDAFRGNWLIQSDYTIRDRLAYNKVEIDENHFEQKGNKIYFSFELNRPKNKNEFLLLTEFWELNTSRKATNDLMIDFSGKRLNTRFGIFATNEKTETFKRFFNSQESFQIKSILEGSKDLYALYYQQSFDAAPSPMSTTAKGYTFGYAPKKVIPFKTGSTLQFAEEGLYLIVEDTTQTDSGFSFLLTDTRFPRLTRPEYLVQPVAYMSTKQEINNITENKDAKQALDRYFLTITNGNMPMAKKIIKSYYNRVEEANRIFTTYKEGWKTDKGMIYIVLGPPNKVQRNRNKEVWVYSQTQNFSEILFTFYKKPNQFTDNNYELVRYPEYQSYWYPYVEAWRTGNITE